MGRGSGSARVGEERGGENGDGYGAVCAGSVMRSVLTSLCRLRGSLEGMAADRRERTGTGPTVAFCICHMSLPP